MAMKRKRPHLLGIDDGPFDKDQVAPAHIVGVTMEGCDLVENVALGSFPVDGSGATEYLTAWIQSLRVLPSLQAILLGGITIAGLGVVDIERLSTGSRCPVLVINRKNPLDSRLGQAFEAAGYGERVAVLERTPAALPCERGLFVAVAGASEEQAQSWVRASLHKAQLPEPLRLAHLIARALTTGQSRGRA
jgi:endonuclease V-like protein UPF0215 family